MKLSLSYSQEADNICINSVTTRIPIQQREDKSLSVDAMVNKITGIIDSIITPNTSRYKDHKYIPTTGIAVKEYLVSTFSGTLREVRAGFKRPEAQGFSNNYEYPQSKDHTLYTIISQNPLVYGHFAPVLAVKGSLSKDKLRDFQEHGIDDVVGIKWFYINVEPDTPWNDIFQAICEQCMDSSYIQFPEVEEPVEEYYIPTEDEIELAGSFPFHIEEVFEEVVEELIQEEEEEVVPKRHKYEIIEDDNSDLFEDIPITDEELQRFYEQ